ncbi:MAG: TerC family protein [Planctomycetota bacterium]
MEWIVAVVALVGMEVVLGIDNLVVLAIVTGKLPEQQRPLARRIGLLLALVMRIVMLFTITFLMRANQPVFYLTDIGFPSDWFAAKGEVIHPESADEHFARLQNPDGEARGARYSYEVNAISVRDLIMILGGLFLIRSSVKEIHHKIEHRSKQQNVTSVSSFRGAIMQIAAFDMLFSFDSVITAVGMAEDVWVMVVAVVLAIAVMMMFADSISDFVNRNPTLAMLALSFLILIGVMLVAEGLGTHVNKKYIYFAMAFSLAVELLNLRAKSIESPAASPA